MKIKPSILYALLSGLLGAAALLGFLSLPVQAAPSANLRVCQSGCTYETIQMAVDDAVDGDIIQVAGGVYTGVSQVSGLTQTVYINKPLTIIGGYNQDFTEHNPELYPTTVDAQGQGRVFYVIGVTNTQAVTLENLNITGGDASQLMDMYSYRSGGGVYVISASLVLSDSAVYGNIASRTGISFTTGYGGGIYASSADLHILASKIYSNTANADPDGHCAGGGLYVGDDSTVEMLWSDVYGNAAGLGAGGGSAYGGGVYIDSGISVIHASNIRQNIASQNANGYGGGMYLFVSQASLDNNIIEENIASAAGAMYYGYGGGIYLSAGGVANHTKAAQGSGVEIWGNSIRSNTAANGLSATGYGGGIFVYQGSPLLERNQIVYNTASRYSGGYGGGLHIEYAAAQIIGNNIVGNSAGNQVGYSGHGGGMLLSYDSSLLINNVVRENRSGIDMTNSQGDGILIQYGQFGYTQRTTLLHNTIYDNRGGDHAGVYVDMYSRAYLINTILVSQTTGLYIQSDGVFTGIAGLDGVLWAPSMTVTVGGSGIVSVTNAVTGWPHFAGDGYGYHLTWLSEARNAGVPIDTVVYPLAAQDIDGDERPYPAFGAPDLGADELEIVWATLTPEAGGQMNYTERPGMTITVDVPPGAVGLFTTLTCEPLDTLPAEPLPPGQLFAGRSFTLDAYQNMQWQEDFQFDQPVEVTIYYRDEDILGIDEASLRLYYWDEDALAWVDGAETCSPNSAYTRDPLNNFINVAICHLSRWDMHGVAPGSGFLVYLPVAAKSP